MNNTNSNDMNSVDRDGGAEVNITGLSNCCRKGSDSRCASLKSAKMKKHIGLFRKDETGRNYYNYDDCNNYDCDDEDYDYDTVVKEEKWKRGCDGQHRQSNDNEEERVWGNAKKCKQNNEQKVKKKSILKEIELIESKRISQEFYCPICLDILVESTAMNPCGHIVCLSCIGTNNNDNNYASAAPHIYTSGTSVENVGVTGTNNYYDILQENNSNNSTRILSNRSHRRVGGDGINAVSEGSNRGSGAWNSTSQAGIHTNGTAITTVVTTSIFNDGMCPVCRADVTSTTANERVDNVIKLLVQYTINTNSYSCESGFKSPAVAASPPKQGNSQHQSQLFPRQKHRQQQTKLQLQPRDEDVDDDEDRKLPAITKQKGDMKHCCNDNIPPTMLMTIRPMSIGFSKYDIDEYVQRTGATFTTSMFTIGTTEEKSATTTSSNSNNQNRNKKRRQEGDCENNDSQTQSRCRTRDKITNVTWEVDTQRQAEEVQERQSQRLQSLSVDRLRSTIDTHHAVASILSNSGNNQLGRHCNYFELLSSDEDDDDDVIIVYAATAVAASSSSTSNRIDINERFGGGGGKSLDDAIFID